jgi:ABC-2 type transport system permease protein
MKILDIALKDLVRFFRSLFAIGMMFIVPLIITGLIYFAFGGVSSGNADLPVTNVVIVNLDKPPAGGPDFGQTVIDMFNDPSVSSWLVASTSPDEATARQMVDTQKAGVAIILPVNFSESMLTGNTQANVLIVQDPTLTVGPMVVKNMLVSLLDGTTAVRIALETAAARSAAQGSPADPAALSSMATSFQQWFVDFQRTLYHSEDAAVINLPPNAGGSASTTDFQRILVLILAGQMVFFSFYTGAYSMMSILTEQEEGTLARQFTTPTSGATILGGKFLAVLLMVIIQAIVMLLAGKFLFHVDWGQPLSILLAVIGQVVASTSLGVFLISFVKDSKQAGTVLGGGLAAMGMLGGLFTVAVPSMPKIFDTVGLFTPHGWVIKAWKASISGAPIGDLLTPIAILLVVGIIMFVTGTVMFRKRFA